MTFKAIIAAGAVALAALASGAANASIYTYDLALSGNGYTATGTLSYDINSPTADGYYLYDKYSSENTINATDFTASLSVTDGTTTAVTNYTFANLGLMRVDYLSGSLTAFSLYSEGIPNALLGYSSIGITGSSSPFAADVDSDNAYLTGTATLASVTPSSPGVPEPSTWAMFIVGAGMIGGVMRNRKKLAATFG